ncbi:MAG: tetratricopeptide repeat protein, partial [Bermanella sp.]
VLDVQALDESNKSSGNNSAGSSISKKSASPLENLAALNNMKMFPQAFELAGRLVEKLEGNTEFDFQFGMAAVETQHYDQALFAFERLVLNEGDQPRYRLELARTHFYLRNLERSEIEFNRVLKQNPPKAVKDNVYAFLLRINDLKQSIEPRFSVSLDISAGFDSNINSATNENFLPNEELVFINDVRLDDDSQETESGYWGTLFNLNYLRPLTKRSAVDFKIATSNKTNAELQDYDLTTALTEAGYNYYFGGFQVRGGTRYQFIGVDGDKFLDVGSMIAEGYFTTKKGFKYGISAWAGLSVYEDDDDGDMNQSEISFSISSPQQKHSWAVHLLAGLDEAVEDVNNFNGKEYQGITLQSTNLWGNRISYYGVLSAVETEYDEINRALYSRLREDTSITFIAGWRYSYNARLGFRNDYSVNDVDSTLEANTYRRSKVEFGMSYSF